MLEYNLVTDGTICLSVSLSVCLSQATIMRRHCSLETVFTPPGSPWTLVSCDKHSCHS